MSPTRDVDADIAAALRSEAVVSELGRLELDCPYAHPWRRARVWRVTGSTCRYAAKAWLGDEVSCALSERRLTNRWAGRPPFEAPLVVAVDDGVGWSTGDPALDRVHGRAVSVYRELRTPAAAPAGLLGALAAELHRAPPTYGHRSPVRHRDVVRRAGEDAGLVAVLRSADRHLRCAVELLPRARVALVHGDLRTDNLGIAPDGTARLIDMEFARRDARVLDLGSLFAPERSLDGRFVVASWAFLDEAFHAYHARTDVGLTALDWEVLPAAVVWTFLKIAVDLQGSPWQEAAIDVIEELVPVVDAIVAELRRSHGIRRCAATTVPDEAVVGKAVAKEDS